jgi:hypothetical protein
MTTTKMREIADQWQLDWALRTATPCPAAVALRKMADEQDAAAAKATNRASQKSSAAAAG